MRTHLLRVSTESRPDHDRCSTTTLPKSIADSVNVTLIWDHAHGRLWRLIVCAMSCRSRRVFCPVVVWLNRQADELLKCNLHHWHVLPYVAVSEIVNRSSLPKPEGRGPFRESKEDILVEKGEQKVQHLLVRLLLVRRRTIRRVRDQWKRVAMALSLWRAWFGPQLVSFASAHVHATTGANAVVISRQKREWPLLADGCPSLPAITSPNHPAPLDRRPQMTNSRP
jgi:hypothetical protein